jgi:class 3 adenylate cyclase
MALLDDLKNKISSYATDKYEIEDTTIVPATDYSKLTFGNKGLTTSLAFLYVDIRKSSELHNTYGYKLAAKLYQSFHEINVRIILKNDGSVRAFDGDRVMGVFSGNRKRSNAVKSAMQIHWAVQNILNPTLKTNIRIGAGVDNGITLITKVGKGRNTENQDLVWIGKASNYASHLSNEADNSTIISVDTFKNMDNENKILSSVDPKEIWTQKTLTLKNDKKIICYESSIPWQIA